MWNPGAARVAIDTTQLYQKLNNGHAIVKELLSDNSGILENVSKTWMCFFTASHTLLLPGTLI